MNPNLPVGGSAINLELGTKTPLPEGLTQLSLGTLYGRFDSGREGTSSLSTEELPRVDVWLATLSAQHFFGEGWSAELLVPSAYLTSSSGNGNVSRLGGPGDIRIGARYDLAGLWGAGGYRPSLALTARLGLPTGIQSNVRPDESVPPNLLSTGYAAFSSSFELRLTQALHRRVQLTVPASVQLPWHRAGESRILMAPRYQLGVGIIALPIDPLFVTADLSAEHLGSANEEPVGTIINSGGFWLRGSLRVGARLGKRVTVSASGGAPLFIDANGRQLVETFNVGLQTTVAFFGSSEEDEDEHDHDHGGHDDHDHGGHDDHDDDHGSHDHGGSNDHSQAGTGAAADSHAHGGPARQPPTIPAPTDPVLTGNIVDVADAATGGADFKLAAALVPGKLTVIDFWAKWCGPCHHIDAMLRKLAAEKPALAVRRAEVIDFDEPISATHLRGVNSLPLLRVYGPHGKRLATITSTSPAVVRHQLLRLLDNTAKAPAQAPAGKSPPPHAQRRGGP